MTPRSIPKASDPQGGPALVRFIYLISGRDHGLSLLLVLSPLAVLPEAASTRLKDMHPRPPGSSKEAKSK